MKKSYKMPKDFLWGCSTSAYQIEGAANMDGKGKSIWDTFSHLPGRISSDHNSDVSCDQYHLSKKDIGLMKSIGLKSYRFSISWPRVLPLGKHPPELKLIRLCIMDFLGMVMQLKHYVKMQKGILKSDFLIIHITVFPLMSAEYYKNVITHNRIL